MTDRLVQTEPGGNPESNPSLANDLFKKALAVVQEGNLDDAIKLLQRAIELKEAYPEAHNNLAALLTALERHSEAEVACRRAIELREAYPGAYNNLGLILSEQRRHREAESAFLRAIALDQTYAEPHNNLGLTLAYQERFSEAEAAYRRAIALKAAYPEAHINLGVLLAAERRSVEAEAAYRQAIAAKPDNYRAYFNLGQLQLGLGRYDEGWRNFEARLEPARRKEPQPFSFPRWPGGNIPGKSFLLVCEQGYGDCIQFVRYARLLKQHGASRVVVYGDPDYFYPALNRLMRAVDGVDACICVKPGPEEFDHWEYMMSLPLRFHTTVQTIPDQLPYIATPLAKKEWRAPAIGLVWGGRPRLHNSSAAAMNQRRSIELSQWPPLLKTPGVKFVSLQKDEPARGQIADLPPELRPIDVMEDVTDFADSAAIIQRLDLVISVDTSVVHLAGALGKPVWLLNRFDGCWRWLHDRGDSPWYPGLVRIFRQTSPNDWSPVIEDACRALQAWRNARQG